MKAEEVFIRHSVAYARSLSLCESVEYLRGMLSLCGDSEVTHSVRETFVQLSHCDAQMELIATGQMKLNLP
jgi:hypothetical protein